MELNRNKFPHDENNRIQKLYYDVNINIIFNRTKLQNVKNKFIKYKNYLIKHEKINIQPNISRWQKSCWKYKLREIKERKVRDDPGYENYIMLQREYHKCSIEINRYINLQVKYNEIIHVIQDKIIEIKTQQKKHKHYKKCSHCDKIDMVIICGCKSKHKLCPECIYDKTECPICKEDLGLQHCDICYEYKKKIVDTGCENKHQICKDCLDIIKQKNNKCPFCRGCCSTEPLSIPYNGDFHGRDSDNGDGITMHMENLRERYPSRRYTRSESEEEEDRREDRRENMREDRRESMRERAREHRANARR